MCSQIHDSHFNLSFCYVNPTTCRPVDATMQSMGTAVCFLHVHEATNVFAYVFYCTKLISDSLSSDRGCGSTENKVMKPVPQIQNNGASICNLTSSNVSCGDAGNYRSIKNTLLYFMVASIGSGDGHFSIFSSDQTPFCPQMWVFRLKYAVQGKCHTSETRGGNHTSVLHTVQNMANWENPVAQATIIFKWMSKPHLFPLSAAGFQSLSICWC